jgi:hypothetical protein
MITTTLAQLMEAQPALERLAAERLPVKAAYRVAKVLRLARPEIEQFIEQRNTMIRELGAERRQANGETTVEVTPANRDVFVAKVTELASLEVTLEIDPLEVGALDGAALTATDLLALDRFIV